MASSTLIVNVVISKSTRTVSLQAFNVAAIFGFSGKVSEPTAYNDAAAMLVANGGPFLSSDPEYIEANALRSQAIKPAKFLVCPASAAVAQHDTFQVNTLTSGHAYHFTINTVPVTFTAGGGDTQQSILAALLAAIGTAFPTNPPVTGAVTGSGGSALLTLVSSTPGLGVSITSVDASLTHATPTANHSVADDIVAAQAAVLQNNQFYGVLICSHVASDILQVATYVESQLLVFLASTSDADCLTNVTTDILSQLKSLSFDRTMGLYSAHAATQGPAGAWMGYMLPTTPGSSNWADKTLVGVDADNLNPTQISNLISKNGNFYVTIGGNGTTLYGIAAGGEYFDVTIFLDWVASNIQAGIIQVVTDPLNLKIPYTNQGITMIENPIRQVMRSGEDNGGFAPGWKVFSPNVLDVPKVDKLNRVLNNIGFDAVLAGAINTISVQGFVSA